MKYINYFPLLLQPDELAAHRAKDNEIRYILEQAVIQARGVCDTDEELDDSYEQEEEKEVDEEKAEDGEKNDSKNDEAKNEKTEEENEKSTNSEKSEIEKGAVENGESGELLSPVRSIPDAMEKDNSTEKELNVAVEELGLCSPGGTDEDITLEGNTDKSKDITDFDTLVNGNTPKVNGEPPAVVPKEVEKVLEQYAAEDIEDSLDEAEFTEGMKDED